MVPAVVVAAVTAATEAAIAAAAEVIIYQYMHYKLIFDEDDLRFSFRHRCSLDYFHFSVTLTKCFVLARVATCKGRTTEKHG